MAIDLVTNAIMERIKASLGNQEGVSPDNFVISLATPDEGASNADLVLFPYLITPEAELRNAERLRPYPNVDDPPRLFTPAVPLELRYLVTTGGGVPTGTNGLARLAGAIRAIEAAVPTQRAGGVPGAVWLSLLSMTSDEMARIWGLFPNENCRSSFAFRASPVWIDPRDPAGAAVPVSDDRFHSGPLQGGRA